MLYAIEKQGAYFVVISKSSRLVQYRSMTRKNCKEWVEENDIKQPEAETA